MQFSPCSRAGFNGGERMWAVFVARDLRPHSGQMVTLFFNIKSETYNKFQQSDLKFVVCSVKKMQNLTA